MFERYTEKARRVIFFARYEASQYGSLVIDAEHILLGLLREDSALMHRYVVLLPSEREIRADLEKVIQRAAPISTSVEVPLNAEAKRVLNFAGEEAERLSHRHVGTEHILLGILRLQDSLAARLLTARGAKPNLIREQVAKGSASVVASVPPARGALAVLDDFLGLLKGCSSTEVAALFHDNAQVVDSSGKRWIGRQEIEKGAATLFAPFAKRNSCLLLEDTITGPSETCVASILCESAASTGNRSKSMFRMSVVLACAGEEWTILLAQLTPL
jgi:ketosteroid isomerase-like protein